MVDIVLKAIVIVGLLMTAAFFFVSRRIIPEETPPFSTVEEIFPATATPVEETAEKHAVNILPPIAPIVIPLPPEVSAEKELPDRLSPEAPPQIQTIQQEPAKPALPPLDEGAIRRAVVKIECPTASGIGKYVGSGFVLPGNRAVTAAHVVMNSGSKTCTVIFSNADRRPVHYLYGALEDLDVIRRRHDEEGIDVAVLTLPPLASYSEARAIFPIEYPYVPYTICENPKVIGDTLFHFGYPSNFVDQNYLSQMEGEAVVHADITGMEEKLSQDGTFTYKNPILEFSYDESRFHPYTVSRVATFYGDSGGLAFNAAKQCILGIHRSATIGRSDNQNYSIFINLGWDRAKQFTE